MALLGMQADMQCKTHFPGHHTSWDLNLDANGNIWILDDADKISKIRQYSNGTLSPQPSDMNLWCNKDLLKQTILEHDKIFRDQIQELHRLYRRQRELMDETKRSELYKPHQNPETVQSNHICPNSFDYACHTSSLPSFNPVCHQSPVSDSQHFISPPHLVHGKSMQAGSDLAHVGGSSKNSEIEYQCKTFSKKILDLELLAEEYIDIEEEGFSEAQKVTEETQAPIHPLKAISEVVHNSNKEHYVCSNGFNSISEAENLTPTSVSLKKRVLADLNIPIKLEEEAEPQSVEIFYALSSHGQIPCQDLPGQSNAGFQVQLNEMIPNCQTIGGKEACLDTLRLKKHKSQTESITYYSEVGQSRSNLNSFCQGLCSEDLFESLQHIKNEEAPKSARFHVSDDNSRKLCDENLQSVGRDLSANSYPGTVPASKMSTANQVVLPANVSNAELSPISSWRHHDFIRTPIVVQALPCFNTPIASSKYSKSSIRGPGLAGNELLCRQSLKFSPNLGSSGLPRPSCCNDSLMESRMLEGHSPLSSSDCLNCNNDNDSVSEQHIPTKCTTVSIDVKSAIVTDLKSMPPGYSTEAVVSRAISGVDGGKSLENPTEGLPCLTKKSLHIRSTGERNEQSATAESVLIQASSVCIQDVELKKLEAGKFSESKKILGFPIHDKSQCLSRSCLTRTRHNPSEKEDFRDNVRGGIPDINLELHPLPDTGKQIAVNELPIEKGDCKQFPVGGVLIDLNSCIDEDESQPMPFHPLDIDLEPPESPENKESSPPRGESDEKQVQIPLVSSGHEDGDLDGELARFASETMVLLSSSKVQSCLERPNREPSKALRMDSLYWFATVASTVVDDPESEYGIKVSAKDHGHSVEHLCDVFDYFEAMTLKLEEIKAEEYCCKSTTKQEEEKTASALLSSQPRRGRTRRGRQHRKDFQSEILPNLATLSRYEVTEDLQMIGGLMEASGGCWESGSSRNAGRNGCARGRRRSSARSSSAMESTINVFLKQQSQKFEERRLIDWGKITRRPRGPRCPSSNPRLILGQV